MTEVADPNVCFGVHWNVSEEEALSQFVAWGFRGIKNFKVEQSPINGNAARTKVIRTANRQGGSTRYYFSGSYDWAGGITLDSAIYRFEYDSYLGNDTSSDPADKQFAGYTGT